MLSTIRSFFFNRARLHIIDRNYLPKYFIDQAYQTEFEKNGYVIIKNCVDPEYISKMKDGYDQLMKFIPNHQQGSFFTTGNMEDPAVRNFANDLITDDTARVLEKIFDINCCRVNCGGAFSIKPPTRNSRLGVHQDNSIIDETTFYAVYIWIPLCDMHRQNGALNVLPGSHLWGNHQRARFLPWWFGKHTRFITNHMKPLYVNKGDLICFDSAMIHSSDINNSREVRVAISAAVLPKNYKIVHYYKDHKTPKGKVEKYYVDEHFFLSEDVSKRPPANYEFIGYEEWLGGKWLPKKELKKLIEEYE